MTVIEKIKAELADSQERIALLVEYYEAAEAEFKYVGVSGDTGTYRRLKKAREGLERETP